MTNAIIEKAKERFAHSHESLAREFGSIRAGRANASLLDRITVEYYGAPTPLNQLASITVPEARVLLISPFDKGSIADIERAINESDLGINPANDGSRYIFFVFSIGFSWNKKESNSRPLFGKFL